MIKIESMEKEFEELVEERRKSIQLEVDKKLDKLRKRYFVLELITTLIGFGLIIYSQGFLLALGIWFVLWGNNIAVTRSIYLNKSLFKEIWKDQ